MRLLFLYLICIFSTYISAQLPPSCGSDLYESIMLANDQEYLKKSENFELKYQQAFRYNDYQNRSAFVTYTLPVVFHVIHDGGSDNLPDDVILKCLENLNQAFAKEGVFYNDQGVDTHIQFCLATRDEQGRSLSGIKRYRTPYTDMSNFGGFEWLKDSIILDYNQYINIQIVKNACSGSNCNVDGFAGTHRLVVKYSSLLTSTFYHEMGHYLGLRHTFIGGCKNDDCLKDGDLVCDTPPANKIYTGCDVVNSCMTDVDDPRPINPYRSASLGGLGDQPDDHANYMNYNFKECRNKFTQGQTDRMRFVI